MSDRRPVEATEKITVTLQAQEWNQLLNVLADAPFKIVAPLIQQITQQAQMQEQENNVHPLPNGSGARPHSPDP